MDSSTEDQINNMLIGVVAQNPVIQKISRDHSEGLAGCITGMMIETAKVKAYSEMRLGLYKWILLINNALLLTLIYLMYNK